MASLDTNILESILETTPITGTYIVVDGDTFKSIAVKVYGNITLFQFIASFNELSSDDDLETGQIIKLPTLTNGLLNRFVDRYGKDFAITSEGYLAIGSGGDLKLVSGIENILQHIKLELQTLVGTYLHSQNYGFASYIGLNYSPVLIQLLELDVRKVLLGDDRIQKIDSLDLLIKGDVIEIKSKLTTILSESFTVNESLNMAGAL